MKTVYLERIEPFLDGLSRHMALYAPRSNNGHFAFARYTAPGPEPFPLNPVRSDTPPKEFVFPLREIAAVFPEPVDPESIEPFAVLGLKSCDMRSLAILDRVFSEDPFEDPHYLARRRQMVTITSDCHEPAASCFCNTIGGQPYAQADFDLNLSPVAGGYVVDIGTDRGQMLIDRLTHLFEAASPDALQQRDSRRARAQAILSEQNQHLQMNYPLAEMMEAVADEAIYNEQADSCVECQACTRVCPTCHCFYLYDRQQQDTYHKLKMWDSCMRLSYARVAGGGNPRITLGDRLRHRLMHKFSYFAQRYGVDMCVGCGRCVDAEAGAVDIRVVLQRINEAFVRQKTVSS